MTDGISNKWQPLGYSDEVTRAWKNGPIKRIADLLDRALEIVNSVPYTVTLRWLFYNLHQEGWFEGDKAKQYKNFSDTMSRLRHSPDEFLERWPIELADDRRDPIHYTEWYRSPQEWLAAAANEISCNVDNMVGQANYIMIAFEAEAMQRQFVHYAGPYGVSLWPFSGMTSIPYKKRMARHIEIMARRFNLPVIILYFGDYDDAGQIIGESSFRHVRKWCGYRFDAFRVGLTLGQVRKYNIPSDINNPGKYQWEALPDQAAKEVITEALDRVIDRSIIKEIEKAENDTTQKAREALRGVINDLDG